MHFLAIIITAIFVNNIVFAQFLGICPFIGVSKRLDSAIGMGLAVTLVMAVSTLITWLLQYTVLIPLGLQFIQTILFILVIAIIVQMIEIIIRRISPSLYAALGVFLPLITTNCAVLGVAIMATKGNMPLIDSLVYAISTAIGFTLALIIFAAIRTRLALTDVPSPLRGVPVSLLTAGLLSLAFMG
ncbi:MAG: RnfABCDGE type electron transport complex subunit A, partial [Odoribacter sp.]|nr:RnfABCDGE type electron transport complex subunit A [Odoribacter sp.]